MDLDALRARLQHADPEARSQLIQELARTGKGSDRTAVVRTLIEALGDNDPVVKEWASVALRRFKGDPEALRALWGCYAHDPRESIRCYALVGLGRLGEHLSADQLRELYRERRSRHGDLLLLFAIHWTGQIAHDSAMLQALCDIHQEELRRIPVDPEFKQAAATAALRAARHCLADRTIAKAWLKERGQTMLLDKLGETRMERLLEAELARAQQLPLSPKLEATRTDALLVPGHTLADFQAEQHVQDLVEWTNVRFAETRSYVRDQFLARQSKEAAGYACQICGDQVEDPVIARRFVHSHHIEPLGEKGQDVLENLIVLCPNCHSRVHAHEYKIEPRDGRLYVAIGTAEPQPLPQVGGFPTAAERREAAACRHIVHLFAQLNTTQRAQLLSQLSALTSDAPRGGTDGSPSS